MRRWGFPAIGLLCGALALPATAAGQERRIAAGVSAGGIDLSNKTIREAAVALRDGLAPALLRPIAVDVAGRRFRLEASTAKQRFDATRTAKRAYYAGRDHPPPPAPAPGGGGTPPGLTVPLAITRAEPVVASFARRVASAATTRPRDATVHITLRHIYRRKSRSGRTLDPNALAAAIDAAWNDPAAPHKLRPARVPLAAKVTSKDLARVYSTVLTIDRDNFKLRVFKRLRFSRSYPIAVGMAGLDTPAGVYAIADKQVNPAWHVPRSAWAGSLAGQTIPGGAPNNPLKARWLGIAAGVGIHGTAEDWSIGTRASHGCIRMHVSDVIDLYPRVPVGTRVLIR